MTPVLLFESKKQSSSYDTPRSASRAMVESAGSYSVITDPSNMGYNRRYLLDLNFRASHANHGRASARDRRLTDRRARHGWQSLMWML